MGWVRRMAVVLLPAVLFVLDGSGPAAAGSLPPRDGIVISLGRQRLYEYHRGRLTHALRISTASGDRYYSEHLARWVRARTPRGTFQIHKKIRGWKQSEYGRLY